MGRKQTEMHNATDASFLGLMSFDSGSGNSQFSPVGFDHSITGQPLSKQEPASRNFQTPHQFNSNPLSGQRMYPVEFNSKAQRPDMNEGFQQQSPQYQPPSYQQQPQRQYADPQRARESVGQYHEQIGNQFWGATQGRPQQREMYSSQVPDRIQSSFGVFPDRQTKSQSSGNRGIYPDRPQSFGGGTLGAEHFQPSAYMQPMGQEQPSSNYHQNHHQGQNRNHQPQAMIQPEYINPQHFHPNQVPSYGDPDQWRRMQGVRRNSSFRSN